MTEVTKRSLYFLDKQPTNVLKYICKNISLWIRIFHTNNHQNKNPNELDVQPDTHVALLKLFSKLNILSQAKQQ